LSSGRWTLTRRIVALCAGVALLLGLLAAAAAATAVTNRGQIDLLTNEVGPARTDAEQLLTAELNQETGVRGYVATGDPDDLRSYGQGLSDERRLADDLRGRLTRIGAGTAAMDRLLAEAAAWRRDFADPAVAAARAGDAARGRALLGDPSRAQFDRIRARASVLHDELSAKRTRLIRAVRDTSNLAVFLLVTAGAVVIAAGVLLGVLLHRMLARPVTRLAAQVRDVADGAYERPIIGEGPPELLTLAADVDSMRRQIAADLSEVQRARAVIEEANERLERQAEELTRSNRDLEQFAYVASHDLQEPLRKVSSFCQLLQRRYSGQLDERADQYIAFAVDGATRMQRLINDLLAFSRIGRITSGFADVDLAKLAADARSSLEPALEAAGGTVTWDDLPTVRGEEGLLSMLVTNLISNSLKFHREGVAPHVHLSAHRDGNRWEVAVADNGIGIEPEFAEKVFVIFQRLHGRDRYPGTGIGLAIAKKIVEYHDGRIWIDTSRTDGTTIRFTLPVAATDPADATPVAEPGAGPAPDGQDAGVPAVRSAEQEESVV
jgi:signal transduction histidine kinase